MQKEMDLELDLYAEELPEQLDAAVILGCLGTAGSLGTLGGSFGTAGTYGSW
ncbi:thiocillin family RiPP [Paenibacillus tyrfis]|uniref:thiocillin family RiPP n=1 Tax=Paenibacillus tyrfis TaxID=1501230 RepID=UPI000A6F706D|nr:thiocillin family RiPP [Paenibacillus tyrfis]